MVAYMYTYKWDLVEKQWRHRQRAQGCGGCHFFFAAALFYLPIHITRKYETL